MFSFFKKLPPPSIPPEPVEVSGDDAKALADSIYQRNIELSLKNKTLSLLRKLYDISILVLEPKSLAARVSKTLLEELTFEMVGVLLYDAEKDELTPLALAHSQRVHDLQARLNFFFNDITIPVSRSPFLSAILDETRVNSTEHLTDVWDGRVPPELLVKLASEGHVKSSLCYPLVSGGQTIGVLLFSLNRLYGQLLDYEKEPIESFANVVAVALGKALLDEELQEANRRLKGVNYMLSHDVKGILAKNKDIFRALADDDFGPLPPPIKPFVEQMFADTKRTLDSVVSILSAGQELVLNRTIFDLKVALLEEVDAVKPQAQSKGITVTVDVEPGEYAVNGDRDQLMVHVLRNLLENAVNYNVPNGTVKVGLKHKNPETLLVTVQDSGVGITEEDGKNLFKEGARGQNSLKINVHSSGYGLFTAKRTVNAHGGLIGFHSEGQGLGSTFFVELPVSAKEA